MFPIVALFSLALLTLFSVNLTDGGRHHLELTELSLARIQARSLAESGVACALHVLAADTTRSVDARNEPWGRSADSFRDRELTTGRLSVFHRDASAAWSGEAAAADSVYGLVDEESKLNVLVTPVDVLGRLPEFPRNLLWVIQSWQESRDAAGEESQPDRAPSLAEFAAQAGLSPAVTARISRFVTTHGSGQLNLNTVSTEVLGALGFSVNLRNKLLSFREGTDQLAGTADDGVFTDAALVAITLAGAVPLSARESAEAARMQSSGEFTVFSRYFRAVTTGTAARGPGRVTIEAVIHRPADGPPSIVEWFES